MNFTDEIARIEVMTTPQLLDYVVANPHYLAENYYKDLALAIKQRHTELMDDASPSPFGEYIIFPQPVVFSAGF